MKDYRIRAACPEHIADLAAIELAAAALFPVELLPIELKEQTLPRSRLETAQRDGRLWVALDRADRPVGFIAVSILEHTMFIDEVDVLPDHQRKGLGRALIGAVIDSARAGGFAGVTLTTFADLPWNGPFYRRLGFGEVTGDRLIRALSQRLERETQSGMRGRIAMMLQLPAAEDRTIQKPSAP